MLQRLAAQFTSNRKLTRMSTQRFKVVLLGEGRVGKTSILLRYTRGEYNDRQVSTLQASYLDKKIELAQTSVQLSIWDTAGQERFHALGPIYYRDAGFMSLYFRIAPFKWLMFCQVSFSSPYFSAFL